LTDRAPVKQAARVSPYKGLAPYGADDSSYFFGRNRERDVVIANVRARHLTVVYGESGVGKSSLLHAGVLSQLQQDAREDLEDSDSPEFVPVAFSAWRDDPVIGLLEAVRSCVARLLPDRTLGDSADHDLTGTLAQWARELDCEFLIILDQFEEYFLYHGHEEGDGTFDSEFPQALNDLQLPASFLVAIREDAFAKLDRFKTRVPGLLDNYLRIRHLDERCAREAIERPLDAWNESVPEAERVEVEEALVKAILREVKSGLQAEQSGQGVIEQNGHATEDERVEAPYLQLVLTRLWDEEEKEGSRTLRLKTLERLGGAEKIVQNHLDEALGALPEEEQDVAAAVFYYLVTPEGTKIAQSVETLAAYSGRSPSDVERVLEKLATGSTRIVRPVAPAPGVRGGTRYEIFHDVLAAAILDWRSRADKARLEEEREEAERRRAEAQAQARYQRRRAQAFRALAIGLGAMFAIGLAVWAISQQRSADRTRAASQSRKIAQQAVISIPTDPELAVLLARQALTIRDTHEAEEALREALMASNVRVAYRARHQEEVNTAAFSSDGARIVTANHDRTARIWETATGKTDRVLRGHKGFVSSAAFSPNGKFIVTASGDRTARIWDASTGKTLRILRGHRAAVQSAAFSPSGRMIVTASDDHTVRLWDASTGRRRGVLRGHTRAVNSASFSPDGRLIVSSSKDKKARIWRVATGTTVRVLHGHHDFVWKATFNRSGRKVLTASADGDARIWDVRTGLTKTILRGQGDIVMGAAFSPDGRRVLTTGVNGTARVWDVASRHTVLILRGHGGAVNDGAFSPKGDFVLTASRDRTARLWNVPPPPPRLRHAGPVHEAAFSADGKSVVTGSEDGAARVWSVSSRAPTGVFRAAAPVYAAAIGGNGRRLLSAGPKGASLWDVPTERVVRVLAREPLYGGALSPDGTVVALTDQEKHVFISDAAGRHKRTPIPTKAQVTKVEFSSDGTRVATVDQDGIANVFDATTGRPVATLSEPGQLTGQIELWDANFSPDGKLLVTAGSLGTVKLWDLRRELSVAALPGLTGDVYSAAFNNDGTLIVTASQNGRVDLWDRATGRRVGLLVRHHGEALDANFSPDGRYVVTAGVDHSARIVPCDVCAPIHDLLKLVPAHVTRDLSRQERELYLR
jgi:WD40 repeat protein